MLRLLKNKRGEMYIWACFFIVILCIVLSVVFFYSLAFTQAQAQRKGAIQALDKYTQENAIQIYRNIRNHNDTKDALDSEVYIAGLIQTQNLSRSGDSLVSHTSSGNTRYIVSDLQLSFVVKNTTFIYATYTLVVPMEFLGSTIWLEVPITISTQLNAKFDGVEGVVNAYSTGWAGLYDGRPHTITVHCSTPGVTMLYGYYADAITLTEKPSFTEPGVYKIYWRAEADGYSAVTGVSSVIIAEDNSITLGDLEVGELVTLNVDGDPTEFIVVHQGKPSSLYDNSCDGTWLLMKDIYTEMAWNMEDYNNYSVSNVDAFLNGTFLSLLDPKVQQSIVSVKIPYVKGDGATGSVSSGSNGLSAKIFLLSAYEVGFTTSDSSNFPEDGALLDYFTTGDMMGSAGRASRLAAYNGVNSAWCLRSAHMTDSGNMWMIQVNGSRAAYGTSTITGIRPAFVMSSDYVIGSDAA